MQVWVDQEVANLVAFFLQAVVHVFVVVVVHYVVVHAVVIEQAAHVDRTTQVQVYGVKTAVVVVNCS